jgi:hypothetical protein
MAGLADQPTRSVFNERQFEDQQVARTLANVIMPLRVGRVSLPNGKPSLGENQDPATIKYWRTISERYTNDGCQ